MKLNGTDFVFRENYNLASFSKKIRISSSVSGRMAANVQEMQKQI